MGANKSKVDVSPEQTQKSNEIDLQISQDKRDLKRRNHVKILILGAGDAGKSTIIKQMRILHIQGFSKEERKVHKGVVLSNILESMRVLLEFLGEGELPLPQSVESDAEKVQEFVKSWQCKQLPEIPEDIAQSLIRLWSCTAISSCVLLPGHFQLDDSTPYFYSHLHRILDAGYEPTEEDVIRSRVRTTGIVEIRFKLNMNRRELKFQMVDVGGQRSERRKWIHCFEGVTAILFVAPLAEFDQTLFEDSDTNRMLESLDLFGQIVNNTFFSSSSCILFLNKKDILQKKLEQTKFCDYFPEYQGENSYDDVSSAIKDMYLSRIKVVTDNAGKVKAGKQVYPHFTNATDTNNIKTVFNDVSDIIIQKLLGENIYS